MTSKLRRLLAQREQNEKAIKKELAKLPQWGGECNCERNEDTVDLIHTEGHATETFEHCCQCGGVII